MKRIVNILCSFAVIAVAIFACKKAEPLVDGPDEVTFAIVPELTEAWAGTVVKISANMDVISWEVSDENSSYVTIPSDRSVISDDGQLSLALYKKLDYINRYNPPRNCKVKVVAKVSDGRTAECEVLSKGWDPVVVDASSGEKLSSPSTLVAGDTFKVCVIYASDSNSYLPASDFTKFLEFEYAPDAYEFKKADGEYALFEKKADASDYSLSVKCGTITFELI